MWLFTKFGFFSCVCGHPTAKSREPQRDVIMIRARDRDHLVGLCTFIHLEAADAAVGTDDRALAALMVEAKIEESPRNDYRFRITIPAALFPTLMLHVGRAVDYDNFKSEVAANEGKSLYEESLHRVWGVMYGMQAAKHGPGIYGRRERNRAPRAARQERLPNQPANDPESAGIFRVGPSDDGEALSVH